MPTFRFLFICVIKVRIYVYKDNSLDILYSKLYKVEKMNNSIPSARRTREETMQYTGVFFRYNLCFTSSLVFWIDLSLINE